MLSILITVFHFFFFSQKNPLPWATFLDSLNILSLFSVCFLPNTEFSLLPNPVTWWFSTLFSLYRPLTPLTLSHLTCSCSSIALSSFPCYFLHQLQFCCSDSFSPVPYIAPWMCLGCHLDFATLVFSQCSVPLERALELHCQVCGESARVTWTNTLGSKIFIFF